MLFPYSSYGWVYFNFTKHYGHTSLWTRAVKPTAINITMKPTKFVSDVEYTVQCEVCGSVPDTDIRWTQNNRQFERGKVICSECV